MDESSENLDAEKLLEEIKQLSKPRSPVQLIQDASGLFVPGFTALPSVTAVAVKPDRTSTRPESFSTGQLYAFDVDYAYSADKKGLLTFFSPIENIKIPPVQLLISPSKTKSVVSIQAESKIGWDNCELYFVWLPWGQDSGGQSIRHEALARISKFSDILVSTLQIFLDVDDAQIPLSPIWGLGTWLPSSSVESIVFPVNHSRRLIESFFFRLKLSPFYTLQGGRVVSLDRKNLTFRFRFPEEKLAHLYRIAGLGGSGSEGFSIAGNVVPLMNVDLKAWEPETTYSDFVVTSDMRPLGFAGIVSFKKSSEFISDLGEDSQERQLHLPHSTQLSVGFNADGALVSRYGLADSISDTEQHQLLFWMTYGKEINGLKFRYNDSERIQPMQVSTQSLRHSVTLMPCFGGFNCGEVEQEDLYSSLLLNYAVPPQMLMNRDSLLFTVRDVVSRLGYGDHQVSGPFVELRVVDGTRQRVTVVYIDDNVSNPLKAQHIKVVQDYLDQRAPVGSKIIFDVR